MRRPHRVILLAALVALAPVLAGCENIDFDKLDFLGLSQKKKLPGVRKPVFPEGVPGVSQGIPKEYQKSYVEQQLQQQQNGSALTQPAAGKDDKATAGAVDKKTAAVTPAEKPKPKPKRKRTVKRKPKPKPATTAAAPAQPAQPNPAAAQQQSPWPASGQQQQQQQQQTAPWPSAPAPGSYSR